MSPESSPVPNYERNWGKLKGTLPFFSNNINWEHSLDTITTFWRDIYPSSQERLDRFTNALNLPGIPKPELRDATEYLGETERIIQNFLTIITSLAADEKIEWSSIEGLAEELQGITGDNSAGDQAIALLEAISETRDLGLTPQKMRQRIAQHAFDEIFTTGEHRMYDYTGAEYGDDVVDRTTADPLRSEKHELISAIKSRPWNNRVNTKRKKSFKKWKDAINHGDNNIDYQVAEDLEELWEATQGRKVTRKSALYYLTLAEDIYVGLEQDGAFDVDLNDPYGEGEEDE